MVLYSCVKLFIKLGANPNDYGRNGTTVLMYAKTKLIEQTTPDTSLLEILINAGANVYQKDNFNKDIFDYLNIKNLNEKIIADYLKNYHWWEMFFITLLKLGIKYEWVY